jgi:hypothetical protein
MPSSLRLRVACLRPRLDRELAAGAAPWTSPELELRAAQLTAPASRRALAWALGNILDACEEAAAGEAAVTLAWPAVDRQRTALRALADRLAGDAPVRAQGVALVARLVAEDGGPLYDGRRGELELQRRLRDARLALEPLRAGRLRVA